MVVLGFIRLYFLLFIYFCFVSLNRPYRLVLQNFQEEHSGKSILGLLVFKITPLLNFLFLESINIRFIY